MSGIYVHSKRSGTLILGSSDTRVFDQFSFGFLYRCTEVDHIGIQASRLREHKRDQADATSMGLIFEHAMSKRTTLYAGYNLTLNEDTTQFSVDYFNRPAPGDSATLFGAGIRHNF